MVLVKKPDGYLRICFDPGDLNKAIKREHYQLSTIDEIASRRIGATKLTKLDANKRLLTNTSRRTKFKTDNNKHPVW